MPSSFLYKFLNSYKLENSTLDARATEATSPLLRHHDRSLTFCMPILPYVPTPVVNDMLFRRLTRMETFQLASYALCDMPITSNPSDRSSCRGMNSSLSPKYSLSPCWRLSPNHLSGGGRWWESCGLYCNS